MARTGACVLVMLLLVACSAGPSGDGGADSRAAS